MSVATTEALLEPAPGELRLLPAPASDPPYDDELAVPPTLRLVAPLGAPVRPRLRPVPRPVPADDEATGAQHAPGLPPARPFAHALVQRLLEVCAGVRPVVQLRRDTTPELYEQLERALHARPRAQGLRPTRRDVRSVHVQERPGGVAEVCATVLRGDRAGALALRLEGAHGRWLCTRLVGV